MVRVEKVKAPEQYLSEVLKIVPKKYIARTYGLKESECGENLLETLAVKSGRLLKGGEADESSVARKIIEDFIRGKLPWFWSLLKMKRSVQVRIRKLGIKEES